MSARLTCLDSNLLKEESVKSLTRAVNMTIYVYQGNLSGWCVNVSLPLASFFFIF